VAGFVDATKVAQQAEQDAAAPASFAAQLDPDWTVFDRPHGGYLAAVLGRAAGMALADAGHTDPLAASMHYLASPVAGPASVLVDVLRTGRTVGQVRASLFQDGRRCVEALLTMGRLDSASTVYWTGEQPIDLPDPAACVRGGPPPGRSRSGFFEQVDVLLDPAATSFLRGEPDGSGELRGWFSFADDTPPDPLSLLLVVDALPPASLTITRSGWVPTLELTVYVRAVPAPGPLRVRQRATLIEHPPGSSGAMMDETCDVWDSRGRLVAQATQLASIRFATGPSAS
jgi:acyl-coenzyme A thioesterase PaaI-like protein